MKFFGASLVLLAAIAGSTALPETNGERLARGLGPKPPALLRRTPAGATPPKPSGVDQCPAKSTYLCCEKALQAEFAGHVVDGLFGLVGLYCDLKPPKTCKKKALCCKKALLAGLFGADCTYKA